VKRPVESSPLTVNRLSALVLRWWFARRRSSGGRPETPEVVPVAPQVNENGCTVPDSQSPKERADAERLSVRRALVSIRKVCGLLAGGGEDGAPSAARLMLDPPRRARWVEATGRVRLTLKGDRVAGWRRRCRSGLPCRRRAPAPPSLTVARSSFEPVAPHVIVQVWGVGRARP